MSEEIGPFREERKISQILRIIFVIDNYSFWLINLKMGVKAGQICLKI